MIKGINKIKQCVLYFKYCNIACIIYVCMYIYIYMCVLYYMYLEK